MEKESRRDLHIVGTMTASGGIYKLVRITGEGTVDGDLDCLDIKCTGTCSVSGNVKAKGMQIRGVASVRGNLQSERVKVHGQTDIEGDMAVKQAKFDGMVKIEGTLSAEEMKVYGYLQADGDCEAETFFVKGAFRIGGLLNAGNIEVKLHGGCEAREIGGERIDVRKTGPLRYLSKLFKSMSGSKLVADTIEGDEIYLENTEAKVVRGNNVTIGPGCDIELVEYKTNFNQVKGSQVNDSKKL